MTIDLSFYIERHPGFRLESSRAVACCVSSACKRATDRSPSENNWTDRSRTYSVVSWPLASAAARR